MKTNDQETIVKLENMKTNMAQTQETQNVSRFLFQRGFKSLKGTGCQKIPVVYPLILAGK